MLHRKVLEQISKKLIPLKDNRCCIIEIPLLHNLFPILKSLQVNKIILVICNQNLQISRVMHRDKLSKLQIMLIIKSQISSSLAIKKIREIADYILDGNNLQQLHAQVTELYKSILII